MRRGYKKPYANPRTESNSKPGAKSNVVNFRGAITAKPQLRAMGSAADDSMPPGKYRVRCVSAEIKPRGGKLVIVLQHRICEGAWNDGVLLSQWLNVKNSTGNVSPLTKYAKQSSIALGRDIEADDDLDPETVFVGKEFMAVVGFSLRDSDGKLADENSASKKEDKDFLRVHSLLSLVGGG